MSPMTNGLDISQSIVIFHHATAKRVGFDRGVARKFSGGVETKWG